MSQFDIVTPRRIAAFLAQCSIESAFFTRTVENLNYSRAERIVAVFGSRFRVPERVDAASYRLQLAQAYVRNPAALGNFVYANRNGNGSVESGDGYRYRGRGLIMVTGRSNYQHVADGIGIDVIERPELLEEKGLAALSSAYFWSSNSLNDWADAGNIDAISGIVNRGDPRKVALEQEERRNLYEDALNTFGV